MLLQFKKGEVRLLRQVCPTAEIHNNPISHGTPSGSYINVILSHSAKAAQYPDWSWVTESVVSRCCHRLQGDSANALTAC